MFGPNRNTQHVIDDLETLHHGHDHLHWRHIRTQLDVSNHTDYRVLGPKSTRRSLNDTDT